MPISSMTGAPQLETAQLRLRPYRPDDLDALHTMWTDPDVRRYLFDDAVVSRAWVAAEIEASMDCFERHGFGQWAMFLRDASPLIGFCGYRFFHEPPELQLLYGLAPAYWGQGLATEAARAMLQYGFEALGFERIAASTDAPNTASLRVLEKAGMFFTKRVRVEGLDTVYYALTRADFKPEDPPDYRVVQDGDHVQPHPNASAL